MLAARGDAHAPWTTERVGVFWVSEDPGARGLPPPLGPLVGADLLLCPSTALRHDRGQGVGRRVPRPTRVQRFSSGLGWERFCEDHVQQGQSDRGGLGRGLQVRVPGAPTPTVQRVGSTQPSPTRPLCWLWPLGLEEARGTWPSASGLSPRVPHVGIL